MNSNFDNLNNLLEGITLNGAFLEIKTNLIIFWHQQLAWQYFVISLFESSIEIKMLLNYAYSMGLYQIKPKNGNGN